MLTGGHFATTFGATLPDTIFQSIATDADGDAYVSGYVSSATNEEDLFIGKYDLDGSSTPSGAPDFLWQRTLPGGFQLSGAEDIAVDASANVYVVGNFTEAANFDPNVTEHTEIAPAGESAGFLAKFDTNGMFQWVNVAEGGSIKQLTLVNSATESTQAIVTGRMQTEVTIDGESAANTTSTESSDYISQFGSDGTLDWLRALQSEGNPGIADMAADETGIFILMDVNPGPSGNQPTVVLDGIPRIGDGSEQPYNPYVAKLVTRPAGEEPGADVVWAHQLVTDLEYNSFATSIAIGSPGTVYVAGRTWDAEFTMKSGETVRVNGPPRQERRFPNDKMFVVRVDEVMDGSGQSTPGNTWVYAPLDETVGETDAFSLTTSEDGHVYVSGEFSQRAAFASGISLESRGHNDPKRDDLGSDVFILDIDDSNEDASVANVWHIGGPGDEHLYYIDGNPNLSILPDGRIATTGIRLAGNQPVGPAATEFPSGTRAPYGELEVYLAVIDPDTPPVVVNPVQPTNLVAQAVDGGIELVWQDNSTISTEFIIQRGSISKKRDTVFQEIARTSQPTYQDNNASGTVAYRVLAVTPSGQESFVSYFAVAESSGGGGSGGGKGGGKGGPKNIAATSLVAAALASTQQSDSPQGETANESPNDDPAKTDITANPTSKKELKVDALLSPRNVDFVMLENQEPFAELEPLSEELDDSLSPE